MESESRIKESESLKKQVRQFSKRLEELDGETIAGKFRHGKIETELITMQGTLSEVRYFYYSLDPFFRFFAGFEVRAQNVRLPPHFLSNQIQFF